MATRDDIQTAVIANLGLRADDVTTTSKPTSTSVVRRINQVYCHEIPDLVGGDNSKGEWWNTTSATDDGSYQFQDLLKNAFSTVIVGSDPIRVFTDYGEFYKTFDRETTKRGKPEAALLWGREMILRPLPSGVFQIYVPGVFYREGLELGTTQIIDASEEWAIEFGTTILIAEELLLDNVVATFTPRYARSISRLIAQASKVDTVQTPPPRDF